eukprot:TRINITY_DN1263_c0_g1_i1.p1 TRINITY_DN1263_c0_g1~~TRINITY_DN1263_c0_g1_i1.p1  ORF type:complete len:231 (+),score=10.40 TRINITY_DN1263_c0_g1_i1:239-931(+)
MIVLRLPDLPPVVDAKTNYLLSEELEKLWHIDIVKKGMERYLEWLPGSYFPGFNYENHRMVHGGMVLSVRHNSLAGWRVWWNGDVMVQQTCPAVPGTTPESYWESGGYVKTDLDGEDQFCRTHFYDFMDFLEYANYQSISNLKSTYDSLMWSDEKILPMEDCYEGESRKIALMLKEAINKFRMVLNTIYDHYKPYVYLGKPNEQLARTLKEKPLALFMTPNFKAQIRSLY